MPHGKAQVLRELLLHPERDLYLREVAARARVSLSTAQHELARLTAAGILVRTPRGRQVFYRANTASPLYPELRSLLLKTVGLVDVLREALGAGPGLRLAFVYGSFASGQDRPGSDVDLLVVGDVRPRALSAALSEAERQIGREINSLVLATREFRVRLKAGDSFLADVMSGPRIFVIGDADDLARLAEQRRDRGEAGDTRGDRAARGTGRTRSL
jgi:predicted nucleotidyltransferase